MKQTAVLSRHHWVLQVATIDIERQKYILLKVCYVPATSARLLLVLFFGAAVNSTNEANKAGRMPILLKCLWLQHKPVSFPFLSHHPRMPRKVEVANCTAIQAAVLPKDFFNVNLA